MKKSCQFIMLVLAVVFFLSLCGTQSWAGEKRYLMVGDITAIDLKHNTVVIEVPLEKALFTVGGPLSPAAVLKRGDQLVGLADFRVGDRLRSNGRLPNKVISFCC